MFVCVCNAITETDIHSAVHRGVDSLEDLSNELNVGNCCGCCCESAVECLDKAKALATPQAA